MTEIVVLPHHEICPEGAVVTAEVGESICEALLRNDIDMKVIKVPRTLSYFD